MKKTVLLLLSLLLIFICCSVSAASPAKAAPDPEMPAEAFADSDDDAEICMVLAALRKQPHPTFTTNKDNLDTVWIFYTNGEFLQFVDMDQEICLFSCGTYAPISDRELAIHRTGKYMEGAGFGPYSSIHPYTLHVDEYTLLYDDVLQVEIP